MDQRLRHSKETSHQSETASELSARSTAREETSPETLLARDAVSHPVPPSVGERLSRSLGAEPASRPRSWWQRLFKKS